jgi:hypothetical protein
MVSTRAPEILLLHITGAFQDNRPGISIFEPNQCKQKINVFKNPGTSWPFDVEDAVSFAPTRQHKQNIGGFPTFVLCLYDCTTQSPSTFEPFHDFRMPNRLARLNQGAPSSGIELFMETRWLGTLRALHRHGSFLGSGDARLLGLPIL